MTENGLGVVEALSASGKAWVGTYATDISNLFFSELENANQSIQISSFSTGYKSAELVKFFKILDEQLTNPIMKINIIINDDGKEKTVTPYVRNMLNKLQTKYPEQFFPQFFKQQRNKNHNTILHAKLTVIDGTKALIGSANISKSALDSNYEIMIKVVGPAAADLSKMLSHLSKQIKVNKA